MEVESTIFSNKLIKVKGKQVIHWCSNKYVKLRSKGWFRRKNTKLNLERIEFGFRLGHPSREVSQALCSLYSLFH